MYHGKFVGNINQYNTIAGPKDVDLDYFPTWIGKKRVVATSGNTMKYLIDFQKINLTIIYGKKITNLKYYTLLYISKH